MGCSYVFQTPLFDSVSNASDEYHMEKMNRCVVFSNKKRTEENARKECISVTAYCFLSFGVSYSQQHASYDYRKVIILLFV